MRIGPIGSGGFADFYRFNINRAAQGAQGDTAQSGQPKNVVSENKDMDYLERQARNAQRMEQELRKNTFDMSL